MSSSSRELIPLPEPAPAPAEAPQPPAAGEDVFSAPTEPPLRNRRTMPGYFPTGETPSNSPATAIDSLTDDRDVVEGSPRSLAEALLKRSQFRMSQFSASQNSSSTPARTVIRSDPTMITTFDPADRELYDLWAPKR
ncbi:hypothetical protein GLOTRDRAFT_91027 [Gloeophyllum trabeum ATCC 11539]|uniref:Uncharacterized protein n=1 Tax=Gloeophyllum trabeum (strain ATCC 11539 / FP-39264 / Madison 617) TaxID=670483 RepID=S7RX18_GLOTA|nr:uncharacterized protein GLOTRDRAFT_91027 [Gloeophyllum trabeum ATCC 11539]EPQ59430.1 hypothetical protein GLOTRDRAFT_91027 [Gloeophyllum trabeum ATCC 11539]